MKTTGEYGLHTGETLTGKSGETVKNGEVI